MTPANGIVTVAELKKMLDQFHDDMPVFIQEGEEAFSPRPETKLVMIEDRNYHDAIIYSGETEKEARAIGYDTLAVIL